MCNTITHTFDETLYNNLQFLFSIASPFYATTIFYNIQCKYCDICPSQTYNMPYKLVFQHNQCKSNSIFTFLLANRPEAC